MSKLLTDLNGCDDFDAALRRIIAHFRADSGAIHLKDAHGVLALKSSQGIPDSVRTIITSIPFGKGMAGLAAERGEPVATCNIQTDCSGDVRPGARATGQSGGIVVPMFGPGADVMGTLGIGSYAERSFSREECGQLIECGRALAKTL